VPHLDFITTPIQTNSAFRAFIDWEKKWWVKRTDSCKTVESTVRGDRSRNGKFDKAVPTAGSRSLTREWGGSLVLGETLTFMTAVQVIALLLLLAVLSPRPQAQFPFKQQIDVGSAFGSFDANDLKPSFQIQTSLLSPAALREVRWNLNYANIRKSIIFC
jgi:hypothetical protein